MEAEFAILMRLLMVDSVRSMVVSGMQTTPRPVSLGAPDFTAQLYNAMLVNVINFMILSI